MTDTSTPGSTPAYFGGSTGGQTGPQQGANGSLNLSPATTDLYGTGMNPNEAYMPVIVGGTKSTISQQLAELAASDPATVLRLQQQLYHAGYLTGSPTGQLNADTYKAYLSLLRDANRQGTDTQGVLAQQTSVVDAAGGPLAKSAATPRTLGLGKFSVKLTSPIDVAAVMNATAQQLTGMDATSDQIKAITDSLHSKELAQGMADYQQYLGQEEASVESFHGGVAQPGATGVGAGAPTITQPTPVHQGSALDELLHPGGLAPPPSSGQIVTPGNLTPATSPTPNLPANAITLSDGTVLIPPTELVTTGAPSATSMAAEAERGTPQYTAYNALQAYDALSQLVKGGGGK